MIVINENKILESASAGERGPGDFKAFKEWAEGMGLEIGCGTNRFSPGVFAIDRSEGSDADMIWDAVTLPFNDRSFDFVFSSHCLKDFMDPENVLTEWLRVIKPMGYLLLLLPDMEDNKNWIKTAKWKCTMPAVLGMASRVNARLTDIIKLEDSTSFGVILQRLPCDRDKFKIVYTPCGRAVVASETDDTVKVVYPDKSEKLYMKSEVSIDANCRYPDLLSIIGGK